MGFKKGDMIERTEEFYKDMRPGDIDEIIDINLNTITLKKFGHGHYSYNLKLIKVSNWRKRLEVSENDKPKHL